MTDQELKPCADCNGTGDLVRLDGEWMGYCHCQFIHPSDITLDQLDQSLIDQIKAKAYENLAFDIGPFLVNEWMKSGKYGVALVAIREYLRRRAEKLENGEDISE